MSYHRQPEPGYSREATLTPAPPRDVTLLEEHVKVLDQHGSSLCSALTKVSQVVDRLLGSEPSKECAPCAPIPDYPLIGKVGCAARALTPLIDAIHEQISRLEWL